MLGDHAKPFNINFNPDKNPLRAETRELLIFTLKASLVVNNYRAANTVLEYAKYYRYLLAVDE